MENPIFDDDAFDPYYRRHFNQCFNLLGRQAAIRDFLQETGALATLAMQLNGTDRQRALHRTTDVVISRRRPPHVDDGPYSQIGLRFQRPPLPVRPPWRRFLHVATSDDNGNILVRRRLIPELAVDYVIGMCLDLDAARLPDPHTGEPAVLPDLAPDLTYIIDQRAEHGQPPAGQA
jgi:hypothetical protein